MTPAAVALTEQANKAAADAATARQAAADAAAEAREHQAAADRLQLDQADYRRQRTEVVHRHVLAHTQDLVAEAQARTAMCRREAAEAIMASPIGCVLVELHAARAWEHQVDVMTRGAYSEVTGAPRDSYELPPTPYGLDDLLGPLIEAAAQERTTSSLGYWNRAVGSYVEGSTDRLPNTAADAHNVHFQHPVTGDGHGMVGKVRRGGTIDESTRIERNPDVGPQFGNDEPKPRNTRTEGPLAGPAPIRKA